MLRSCWRYTFTGSGMAWTCATSATREAIHQSCQAANSGIGWKRSRSDARTISDPAEMKLPCSSRPSTQPLSGTMPWSWRNDGAITRPSPSTISMSPQAMPASGWASSASASSRTRSGRQVSSASRNVKTSPRAVAMPLSVAAFRPPLARRSARTRWPYAASTSGVESVEPSSTTITSSCGQSCASALSMAWGRYSA